VPFVVQPDTGGKQPRVAAQRIAEGQSLPPQRTVARGQVQVEGVGLHIVGVGLDEQQRVDTMTMTPVSSAARPASAALAVARSRTGATMSMTGSRPTRQRPSSRHVRSDRPPA
jgi:hypothetical protein